MPRPKALLIAAPGIFREIFQMTNPNPRVQRRDETPSAAAEESVRASSTTMAAPTGQRAEETPGGPSDTIDGWSSTIENQPAKKH